MLYNDPKVIFIHMPKTGGSSIEHLFARTPWLLQRDGRMGQHERLQTAADIYGDLSDYKIFGVMRNTYDRLVSLYSMFYSRGGRGFRRIRLTGRYVSFPMYYNRLLEIYENSGKRQHFAQDYMYYFGVDGKLPDNLEIIHYDDLSNNFKELWCDKWGFELVGGELPHNNQNRRVAPDSSLRRYLRNDPDFHEVVEIIYKDELDYFNYEPIEYSRNG